MMAAIFFSWLSLRRDSGVGGGGSGRASAAGPDESVRAVGCVGREVG